MPMVVDTHTHIGAPSTPQPLLFRTEQLETYKTLAVPEGVTGTVVVESSGNVEDNQWMLDRAAKDPFIVGIVGHLDPFAETFTHDLERNAADPLFKGFRLHMDCCHDYVDHPRQAMDSISPRLIANLERLAARDLALDFHGDYTALGYVAELMRRVPGLRVVLNHLAEGRPIDGRAPNPEWVRSLHEISAWPQVYCKVSALVQMTEVTPAPADVEYYRPALDAVWDSFGQDRLIYASNWPQIERVSDFATAHQIVARYFEGKGRGSAEKYFWRNASIAYNLIAPGD